jgi:hypothetical protein
MKLWSTSKIYEVHLCTSHHFIIEYHVHEKIRVVFCLREKGKIYRKIHNFHVIWEQHIKRTGFPVPVFQHPETNKLIMWTSTLITTSTLGLRICWIGAGFQTPTDDETTTRLMPTFSTQKKTEQEACRVSKQPEVVDGTIIWTHDNKCCFFYVFFLPRQHSKTKHFANLRISDIDE